MRRLFLLLTSVVLLSSCADAPTRVDTAIPSDQTLTPSFDIVDGSRGGGAGFYWLPPMVTSLPSSMGTFDNTAIGALEVQVCALEADSCVPGGLDRRFTSTTGSFFDRVRLFANTQYQVMYASAADNLDASKDYRATVRAYGVVLGYADIDVVSTLPALQAVDRTRFAALYRGQSLAISFRVDNVFPAACSAESIDALALQVFGAGLANDAFRAAIRRLAYLYRFSTAAETEIALQELADDLNQRLDDAAGDPALRAVIEQLLGALYCVVDQTVPVPPVEGTVTGTITGTNGRGPLSDVVVRVDPAGLSGTSDATGRYTIVNVPAGPVTVLVTGGLPSDCTVPAPQNAVADAGSVTVDFEVECEPGAVAVVPATLVSGGAHTCGLTSSGAAYCWGNAGLALGNGSVNGSSVPVPVSGGLTFETLSAGDGHTCGVTTTGAAYCWGTNSVGQLGDGTNNQRATPVAVSGGLTFASISAGNVHTCGITRTGAAYCWGLNQQGRLGDGTFINRLAPVAVVGGHVFKSLAVSRSNVSGQGHSCGVTTDGDVYCWGNNTNRQLGILTPTQSPEPLKVPLALTFTEVVAGTLHTCALGSDGRVYCWGFGPSFGPGIGSGLPTQAGNGQTFASLAAGIYHTCGLTAAGAAYCFGTNSSGELGNGTSRSDGAVGTTPVAVSGDRSFAVLSAGGGFTCGVTNAGEALCWGAGRGGELGDGTTGRRHAPVPVLGGLEFAALAAGGEQTCGVANTGAAYCWGENQSSRLGDGTTLRRHAPWPVSGGTSFARIFSSPYPTGEAQRAHSCALTAGGDTYCWGNNSNLQLGVAGGTRTTPVPVASVPAFETLTLGAIHSCGLTDVGQTYCWGSNVYGTLGRGTGGGNSQTPGPISGDLQFSKLASGSVHTCGLTASGAAYCWGRNNRGQLGDGTSGTDRSEPVPVGGGLSFVSIAAGFEHTCGVAVGGGAYCWGYGNFGQLGDGTTGPANVSLTPVAVLGGQSFTQLSAGYYHTCGITSAGNALCWGWNQSGQIGDGTNAQSRTTPVAVAGGLQFLELHTGRDHTCGLASTGNAYCWGWSEKGRLGDEYIRRVAGGLVFRRP